LSYFQDKGRKNELPGTENTSLNFIGYTENNCFGAELAAKTIQMKSPFLLITNLNLRLHSAERSNRL